MHSWLLSNPSQGSLKLSIPSAQMLCHSCSNIYFTPLEACEPFQDDPSRLDTWVQHPKKANSSVFYLQSRDWGRLDVLSALCALCLKIKTTIIEGTDTGSGYFRGEAAESIWLSRAHPAYPTLQEWNNYEPIAVHFEGKVNFLQALRVGGVSISAESRHSIRQC